VIVCESERLILRRLDPQVDAAFILRLLNEPSFIANIADRGVRTLAAATEYIASGPCAMYEQHGFGLFRTDLRATGEPIGMCGLLKRDWLAHVDVGFAFFPEYWKHGYAFESASAVMKWGREQCGLARIVAITAAHNHGSQRVLTKLGLTDSGRVRSPQGQESILFS
jgi:RimJ/RimL family protein N-acetyltransferase